MGPDPFERTVTNPFQFPPLATNGGRVGTAGVHPPCVCHPPALPLAVRPSRRVSVSTHEPPADVRSARQSPEHAGIPLRPRRRRLRVRRGRDRLESRRPPRRELLDTCRPERRASGGVAASSHAETPDGGVRRTATDGVRNCHDPCTRSRLSTAGSRTRIDSRNVVPPASGSPVDGSERPRQRRRLPQSRQTRLTPVGLLSDPTASATDQPATGDVSLGWSPSATGRPSS